MSKKISAGLLMWRKGDGAPEVLLVHSGGPYFTNKDEGHWGMPKGLTEEHEKDLLEVAKREFGEETGFAHEGPYVSLGFALRKDGKELHVWAFEGDADTTKLKSNLCDIEWPPKSGKIIQIPEVDRGAFFTLTEARKKIQPYMNAILDTFEKTIMVEH